MDLDQLPTMVLPCGAFWLHLSFNSSAWSLSSLLAAPPDVRSDATRVSLSQRMITVLHPEATDGDAGDATKSTTHKLRMMGYEMGDEL